jgi:hypothetical protein
VDLLITSATGIAVSVEQPKAKFELVISLKTAKQIVSRFRRMARADRVIR